MPAFAAFSWMSSALTSAGSSTFEGGSKRTGRSAKRRSEGLLTGLLSRRRPPVVIEEEFDIALEDALEVAYEELNVVGEGY